MSWQKGGHEMNEMLTGTRFGLGNNVIGIYFRALGVQGGVVCKHLAI